VVDDETGVRVGVDPEAVGKQRLRALGGGEVVARREYEPKACPARRTRRRAR
jgi:hypothetical protein